MKKSVQFANRDIVMAGELYLPAGFDENVKYPALVCVHPGGGVKEQTIGLYAGKLSEHGFVSLTFDASHQGESGGMPRHLEDPAARVEDVRSAVDYLTTLSYVDRDKIGVLGICAGGGYAVNAALTEKRIKAVGTVNAVDIGAFFRNDGADGSVKACVEMLDQAGAERTEVANGAKPRYLHWTPCSLTEINEKTSDLMREAYDYYRTPRGEQHNSVNEFLMSSIDLIMGFSAFGLVPTLLTQPLLAVAGSNADTLVFSKQAVSLSRGSAELFQIEGATHVAMYDVPEYVDQAVAKLVSFYKKNLG